MIKTRKMSFIPYLLMLIMLLVFFYLASGIFLYPDTDLSNFKDRLYYCLQHPLERNWWNEKTPVFLMCGLTIWLMALSYYAMYARNYMFGKEHGTAKWADVKKLCRKMEAKNGHNRILTENFRMSTNIRFLNNNVVVFGGPGAGKSLNVVAPNLLLCQASFVILDVKGELLSKYGRFMEHQGMRIRVVNTKDKEKSHQYNPFRYVKREDDIVDLVMNIYDATTIPEAHQGDEFWSQAFRLYLQSLFYYVWMETPHPTLNRVLELMKLTRAQEGEVSELTQMMERLAAVSPLDTAHPAYRDYNKLITQGAEETVRSVIVTANAKLTFFEGQGIRRIFADDELDLEFLGCGVNGDGKTKTALFIVTEDGNHAYDFVTGMLYTQCLSVLKRMADNLYGGSLPIPVELWMDEFANGSRPSRMEEMITTLRSRNIAAIMFLQSLGQLKNLYKQDKWEIFLDGSSTIMYLGNTNSPSTAEFISKKLGARTIDKKNEGEAKGQMAHSSRNFDNMKRNLLEPDEVERMPKTDCIVFVSGEDPIYDQKFDIFKMEEYRKAVKSGRYETPVKVKTDQYGNQTTIKPPFSIQELTEKEAEYYKRLESQGDPIMVLDLDELSLLEMDFLDDSGQELTLEEIQDILAKNKDKILEAELEEQKELQKADIDLSRGTVFDWLSEYPLSDGQREEVITAIEEGFTDDEIRELFDPDYSPQRMNQIRRLIKAQKKAGRAG